MNCYQAPSHQQCSETFYRDCVTEELASRGLNRSDPQAIEEVQRMHEILKKMNDALIPDGENDDGVEDGDEPQEAGVEEEIDSDDEDDEGPDLAARLEGIDLDDPDAIWTRLTSDERQEFELLLKTGDIQNVIPSFQPWWEIRIQKTLIVDMDETQPEEIELKHPMVLDNIPSFDTLSKKTPSPCLPHNLYNILSSYTCTVRFFNGEHHLTPVEATKYLIQNSATLKNNANFDDNEQAVKSVIAECDGGDGLPPWEEIACDVEKIMDGPYEARRDPVYVKAALSDIHRLMEEAKHSISKSKNVSAELSGNLDKKKLVTIIRKIDFFLSFVNAV